MDHLLPLVDFCKIENWGTFSSRPPNVAILNERREYKLTQQGPSLASKVAFFSEYDVLGQRFLVFTTVLPRATIHYWYVLLWLLVEAVLALQRLKVEGHCRHSTV
jgi:hypothetical protein